MWKWITAIFEPAAKVIDELHVSAEEKGKLVVEMSKIQQEIHAKSVELMQAESSSSHWLTANWRPLVSITLVAIILMDGHAGFTANAQVYELAQIFLGVYGGGRTLEKGVENLGKILNKGK